MKSNIFVIVTEHEMLFGTDKNSLLCDYKYVINVSNFNTKFQQFAQKSNKCVKFHFKILEGCSENGKQL